MRAEREGWASLYKSEDWWAIWIGFFLLAFSAIGVIEAVPKLPSWEWPSVSGSIPSTVIPSLLLLAAFLSLLFAAANFLMGKPHSLRFIPAFFVIFVLSVLAFAISGEKIAKTYGIGDAFWAVAIGLAISNTFGTPEWLRPAIRTEFYIKTGLVLLGAEILFNRILEFGLYGLAIAWGVTPIVIIFMWHFGNRVLKMVNKPLIITIAASTSVCGVSAAIAAAAACKAKKEDLTIAVGMTLIFTVFMMVLMPPFIQAVGMSELVGGAWMGGTIDSTGAVAAAGAFLGPEAEASAVIVKMIQNILIGLVAFAIALYWVTSIERNPGAPRPGLAEVWYRMPKFILGFIGASLIASFVLMPLMGADGVDAMTDLSKEFRGWLFCLAFLSIGLESNFKEMGQHMTGGKPMLLYIGGQTFNLVLTLLVAWLVLSGIIFPAPPPLAH
ncbi:MAG: putative sulfate exporter family transporter [Candidatus Hydrogenedentes bacterium]|nr:putative sulfate exporter family transporter [Candidatus Hydrogenedentota bacterium]